MSTSHPEPRIGYFVPGWPPEQFPNGIVSYVRNIRAALAERSVASLVVAPGRHSTRDGDIVTLRHGSSIVERALKRIGGRNAQEKPDKNPFLKRLNRELRTLRRSGLEVFEMEESFGFVDLVKGGLATVVRLHGPWFINGRALGVPEDEAYETRVKAEGVAIANGDAVSSPSLDVLTRVRHFYQLELPRARVIPNCGPRVAPEDAWSLELSSPDQILFVGRFDRHKGGDIVLDAFARLATTHPNSRLIFAGPDRSLRDASGRRWSLKDYVAENLRSCAHRVEILGSTSPARIGELRRQSRVCVVASRYENFPMTAVEALAFGCPLVATDIGGISEIVSHEDTGLLFKPEASEELAQQLRRLLDDGEFARTLAANGTRRYQERFSPTVVAESTLAFYEEVTRGPASSGALRRDRAS